MDLLIRILEYLLSCFFMIIIIQFILGLLVMFNVISSSNEIVRTILSSIEQLLEPILRPIRDKLPDTGAIDFSPFVLLIAGQILILVLHEFK